MPSHALNDAGIHQEFRNTAYEPNLEPVSDPDFDDVTAAALAAAWPRESVGYVVLADARAMGEAANGVFRGFTSR